MTRKQLYNYLDRGSEIEFWYNGKKYSITFFSDGKNDHVISFCEYYKTPADFYTIDEFMKGASINGKSVVDVLYDIDDADVW